MEKARSHPSVDWAAYFKSIRVECPWSHAAYVKGLIDIVQYQGQVIPLGQYQARVYVVNASESSLEALAQTLDHGEDEWLFSYPGYGKFATPIKILIQQNRAELNQIRKSLK